MEAIDDDDDDSDGATCTHWGGVMEFVTVTCGSASTQPTLKISTIALK